MGGLRGAGVTAREKVMRAYDTTNTSGGGGCGTFPSLLWVEVTRGCKIELKYEYEQMKEKRNLYL